MDTNNTRPIDSFTKRFMGALQKEYLVIGKTRVSVFTSATAMAFLLGVTITLGFLVSRTGTLEQAEAARKSRSQGTSSRTSPGGWTDDGTIVRLTTSSNKVQIGTVSSNDDSKLLINGGRVRMFGTTLQSFPIVLDVGAMTSFNGFYYIGTDYFRRDILQDFVDSAPGTDVVLYWNGDKFEYYDIGADKFYIITGVTEIAR